MAFLTEQEVQRVADAIAEVEKKTDAELVTVLAGQADEYHYVPTLWAALIALLTPGLVLLLDWWVETIEVLALQLTVFAVLALFLRIPPIMRRIIPRYVRQWRASNLARRQFLENNLHHTEGETGLLIFVSEMERYVEIIADRGISKHVDDSQWQAIIDDFVKRVNEGKTLEGFVTTVERCGELLAEHVPQTHERDELPNRMILL